MSKFKKKSWQFERLPYSCEGFIIYSYVLVNNTLTRWSVMRIVFTASKAACWFLSLSLDIVKWFSNSAFNSSRKLKYIFLFKVVLRYIIWILVFSKWLATDNRKNACSKILTFLNHMQYTWRDPLLYGSVV